MEPFLLCSTFHVLGHIQTPLSLLFSFRQLEFSTFIEMVSTSFTTERGCSLLEVPCTFNNLSVCACSENIKQGGEWRSNFFSERSA